MSGPEAPSTAHGGTIVRELVERGVRRLQRLEFNARGDLRITRDRDDRIGLILRDGGVYFFGLIGDTSVVVDLLAASPPSAATRTVRDEPLTLYATGRHGVQGGIDGEWYRHASSGEAVAKDEMLLTRDPRLAPLLRTLAKARSAGIGMARWLLLDDSLLQHEGLALSGASGRVITIRFGAVDDTRFALPAVPVTDPRIMFRAVLAAARGRGVLSIAGPALR